MGYFLDLWRAVGQAIIMHRNSKFLIFSAAIFLAAATYAETVSKFVTSEQKIREEMVNLSREIGVTCTECHSVQNFADGSKKGFQMGKEHIRITQVLRDSGFDGKKGPLATCFMCHRGKLHPEFKEKLEEQKH